MRWVGWRWVTKPNGDLDKPPCRGDFPDFSASSTNAKTWASFAATAANYAAGKMNGIGYVCLEDDERVFIDMDDCRDKETGEIADWAMRLVEEADSYTEITPSQEGLRIIGLRGAITNGIHAGYKLPCGGHGEVYFRAARYVTVTGDRLPGTPNVLRDIGDVALDLMVRAGKMADRSGQGPGAANFTPSEEATAPIEDVVAALQVISNPDMPYDDWVRVGLATYAASSGNDEGYKAWCDWSAKSQKHEDAECLRVWRSFHRAPPKRIGFGSLYHLAGKGRIFWRPPSWGEGDRASEAGAKEEEPADEAKAAPRPSLWVDAGSWDDAEIPKRPWVVPMYLMRGSVSVLSGQGAGGKSSLVVAWTISLGTGEPIGDFVPPAPQVVINYNVEDDQYEQRRRYSAALAARKMTPDSLQGRVVRCGPSTIGTLFERDAAGRIIPTDAMNALERLCMETQADVLVCDPLAELHNAEENDNTAMRSVIAAFRGMADRLGIAILILHHDRKGTNAPGDMDRMRGASAITGAVRVMLTLSTMTVEDADKFGIVPDERRRHFRIDGAKSNYAPPTGAEWWRMEAFSLTNGEDVAACLPWQPPTAFEGLSMGACCSVLAELQRGTTEGFPWAATKQAGEDWAGRILMRAPFERSEGQAKAVLAAWTTSGLIEVADLARPNNRHTRKGFRVNDEAFSKMKREAEAQRHEG